MSKRTREIARRDPDIFLLVLEDDVVDAAFTGSAGFAARDLRAGEILQFEGDMLEHMTHPGSFAHALKESAGRPANNHGRRAKESVQSFFVETRNLIGGTVFKFANIGTKRIEGIRAQMFGPR